MPNVTEPQTVARCTLPLLTALVATRKQARWQWKNCADEHAHQWTAVIRVLDERIEAGENYIADLMGIPGFRIKREVQE